MIGQKIDSWRINSQKALVHWYNCWGVVTRDLDQTNTNEGLHYLLPLVGLAQVGIVPRGLLVLYCLVHQVFELVIGEWFIFVAGALQNGRCHLPVFLGCITLSLSQEFGYDTMASSSGSLLRRPKSELTILSARPCTFSFKPPFAENR